MKWNLRLAAANRGIWKASELQRLLAERGMVISAGKMSGLWSGQPNTVKLDELDIICTVLGCNVGELLLPEPETVPQPTTAQMTSSSSSLMVFGWPDHRPDIFPALITMPRSASRRCSSLAFQMPRLAAASRRFHFIWPVLSTGRRRAAAPRPRRLRRGCRGHALAESDIATV